MSEKSHENVFKFGIYQAGDSIAERIFSADIYNPVVRYSVDIRDIIPNIISRLQKTLSRRNLDFIYERGYKHEGDNIGETYDLLGEYKNILDGKVVGYINKLTRPPVVTQQINKKTISGVECKFGLYINNNPIVERNFYVDSYNPASRFSLNIVETIYDIVQEIFLKLKNNDVHHMWDDYVLINTYGIYIHQIRELSKSLREKMLMNRKNSVYIKQMHSHFRHQFHQNRNQQ
jgi:hypothetical protein